MDKNRLEAFSDGVIAILITVMVLDFHAPHGSDLAALAAILPSFLSYVLSFIYLAIYWNNHHHLLKAVDHVNGTVLWANMHLLFWLSLVPFVTSWMGSHHFAPWPVALYGFILLAAAVSYTILVKTLLYLHGPQSKLAKAIGGDFKGNISIAIYVVGMAASLFIPWLAEACYVFVAIIWLVPDRRIEKVL